MEPNVDVATPRGITLSYLLASYMHVFMYSFSLWASKYGYEVIKFQYVLMQLSISTVMHGCKVTL